MTGTLGGSPETGLRVEEKKQRSKGLANVGSSNFRMSLTCLRSQATLTSAEHGDQSFGLVSSVAEDDLVYDGWYDEQAAKKTKKDGAWMQNEEIDPLLKDELRVGNFSSGRIVSCEIVPRPRVKSNSLMKIDH